MDQIGRLFAERFAPWDITIPAENFQSRASGHLCSGGWLIQFCFGKDDKGDYLDYYASNRMTGDSHVRIHADGTKVNLVALRYISVTSPDPAEAKRAKAQFDEGNCRIADELVAKGFTLFTINMALCSGFAVSEKK